MTRTTTKSKSGIEDRWCPRSYWVLRGVAAIIYCVCAGPTAPAVAQVGTVEIRGDERSKDQFLECKGREVVKGVICVDDACDKKQIECEVYTDRNDASSEIDFLDSAASEDHFVRGIVDENEMIRLQVLRTKKLVNRGQCVWKARPTQDGRRKKIQCTGKDRFVSGVKCQGGDCSGLQIYCCKAQSLTTPGE